MIACVAKTAQNADFYQIIDFLTGCSINYSLLVDPDLIGPWLQQFWATASLRVINDVPHIRAMQVIWDVLRDIGYEGNLAQLTFSKPLFSPQWKYLVHVLLHCLSPKSTSWEQFGTNIASALVGLATNQKFNFSLMIMNGMLGHISNGTPFLMYPRFVQLFLNKQLEGVARPQDFIPSVTLPSKIFTFMRKHSPKFSCRITPLTPHMLEVVTALAAEEEHSTSPHSRAASSARDAQGTPTQSAAQASISTAQDTAGTQGTAPAQDTAEVQGTDNSQGTANLQGTAAIPKSPNDYTPTDASQTSGGDEGLLDLYALTCQNLKKQKRRRKKQKSSQYTYLEDIVDKDAAVTPDLERKSDETEEINIEEKKASDVMSGDTEELDLEAIQSTARQSTITPRTLNFSDEAGPSSPIRSTQNIEPEEQFEVDKVLADISRPRGLSIPGPIQSQPPQPQQPTQGTDSKDKGKGILVEEPKKKKLTLQQIRALETTNDEELRTETVDEIRNYLRIVDFEKSAQDKESLEGISMITELQVIDSPDGEYLIIHRANNHFRAFDTLWEILHILDRQDLQHLYRVVQSYYEHIPPTGLGLILLGDLTTIWETAETSDDDFWKNQDDWEIIRWRLNESSGVHTLELEDGTMIHMLAERRYPLSRELMIRMLDHGMEVEDESEIAITLIHLFILWTTEDGCVQDTAQRMKLKRLKASTALMTRQTDAEQRRPTIKKLEVKLVEFKLGEDCWEIQVKRSTYCTAKQKVKVLLNRKSKYCQLRSKYCRG
ncbi:hypothetical protein Tco_0797361 [Tanacetum coccineum]